MNLGDADRVVVTTFDAAGQPTTSSEFVVPLGEDRIGLWTPHSTPWVERLKLSDVVAVQAANTAGRVLRTEPVLEGRAELVCEGVDLEQAHTLTRDKYGLAAAVVGAVDWAWEVGGTRTPPGVVVVHIVG